LRKDANDRQPISFRNIPNSLLSTDTLLLYSYPVNDRAGFTLPKSSDRDSAEFNSAIPQTAPFSYAVPLGGPVIAITFLSSCIF
jgi:hypothetical protein